VFAPYKILRLVEYFWVVSAAFLESGANKDITCLKLETISLNNC